MAKTQQELIISALKARGYIERKRQGKYLAYQLPGEAKWLLLGKAGAVRETRGSIADSHPIEERTKAQYLREGENIYYTGRSGRRAS